MAKRIASRSGISTHPIERKVWSCPAKCTSWRDPHGDGSVMLTHPMGATAEGNEDPLFCTPLSPNIMVGVVAISSVSHGEVNVCPEGPAVGDVVPLLSCEVMEATVTSISLEPVGETSYQGTSAAATVDGLFILCRLLAVVATCNNCSTLS